MYSNQEDFIHYLWLFVIIHEDDGLHFQTFAFKVNIEH